MLASLLPLLLDGRVILGLGGIAAFIYAYFKGRSSGKKVIRDEIAQSSIRQAEQLIKTAKLNNELERKVRDEISASYTATDDELIDKFMQLKSSGSPRPKDS